MLRKKAGVLEFIRNEPLLYQTRSMGPDRSVLGSGIENLILLEKYRDYDFGFFVSHEKLIEDNKPEYYLALRKSQKALRTGQPDISSWLNFFLDILLTQSQMAIQLLTQTNIETILSPQQSVAWQYLGKILETTPKEISTETGIPRSTINQILNKLLALKVIERVGQGATTRYRKI